ncbi:hypothetical protein PMAYCL1PPCAC_10714 [Pristionchus mayeri]|uniref:Protein kinase domain-containing protein n=1 Tax=Pristionchus mayeri TaxID=1317129 RepID=A0AAN5CEY7_9BILA|nr:hypothetical protein PMAYCL1PPCAC_10703 [Pristionchus mayeri]GMR40519.1 hypothetical protein PMAYCL1PPCAC_10714 [Pristionchus mayeri]
MFLVSEYCPSTMEKEISKYSNGLPKYCFIRYIKEMSTGMHFMRIRQIHHGDLKPENILISENGTLKLADFGVSSTPDELIRYRRDRAWSGTKEYMAPELHQGASSKFTSSLEMCDVWSYGIVLWQLMARLRPHEGIEQHMLAKKIGIDGLLPPLPSSSNLESLVNLLRKCWNKTNPSRPTFHKILQDLEDVREELEGIDENEWIEECKMWNAL